MPTFRRKTKRTGGKKNGKDDEESGAEGEAEVKAELLKQNKEKAVAVKDEGNVAFAASNWLLALNKFSQCIELDPTDHVFYSNRSGANLALLRTRDAVSDARECVRLKPDWGKGYSRLGSALLADRQAAEAKVAYDQGLKVDPGNAALVQGLELAKTAAVAEAEEKAKEEEAATAEAKPASVSPEDTTVIGIDLGTTYSCVAVWRDGAVEIIDDDSGSRTVPSWVAFTEDGGRLVGESAKGQASRNTKNTFYDIKRILGQKMAEPAVKDECKRFPFEVVADANTDDPRIKVDALQGKEFPPEQLSGLVLAHMKRVAEKRLGHAVKKAVVTVPAYFNDAQRAATKAAGAIAGLDVLRIINEPTAAALAYGLDKNAENGGSSKGQNVLIFDLGGGTFDVSILRIEDGMFTVKATGGDTHLGGEDFDNTVVDHLMAELKKRHNVDAKGDNKMIRKFRTACERAKRALSSNMTAKVEIDDYSFDLTRAKFESLNKAAFDRSIDTVRKVMKDAKMVEKDIDEIVLVGGSTRVPKIQESLSALFGGKTLCKSVNPDEAVAYGAAVQGAILSGVRHAATNALLLVDVTPLSLGIETQGKHFSVIIPRNTSIPCKLSSTYTTTDNYQESIEIPVYEGERPMIDGNRHLGEFTIHNIERAKKQEPQIEVSFELDANGMLTVSARDKKTNAKADVKIEGACKGLDQAEIDKMVKEAELFAKQDEEHKKNAEMKMELEELAYGIVEKEEASGKEGSSKAAECLEWLEDLKDLGKAQTGRQLEKWLRDLRK